MIEVEGSDFQPIGIRPAVVVVAPSKQSLGVADKVDLMTGIQPAVLFVGISAQGRPDRKI
jgi:hypothetical protein